MRDFLKTRVLPFLLVLVATAILTAASVALIYSKGLAFSLRISGVLLQIPMTAALGAVCLLVLTRIKKLGRREAGFVWDARAALELGLGVLATCALLGLLALVLTLTGIAPLSVSKAPPSALALLLGFLFFVLNGAFQQFTLQSTLVAATKDGQFSFPALILPQLIFLLAHVGEHATAFYLLNTLLFGLATSFLFFRTKTPSYAAPIGVHGGWNFMQILVLGSAGGGNVPDSSVFRWPENERLYSGGSQGLDAGLAGVVLSIVVVAASVAMRARSAAVAQR